MSCELIDLITENGLTQFELNMKLPDQNGSGSLLDESATNASAQLVGAEKQLPRVSAAHPSAFPTSRPTPARTRKTASEDQADRDFPTIVGTPPITFSGRQF
jgi:hypothetical protein